MKVSSETNEEEEEKEEEKNQLHERMLRSKETLK